MGVLDIEYNSGNAALKELLLSIDRPGDFCAHGKLFAPMPRLEVEGVGLLSFPVPDMQVRALIAVAERTSYGKGPDTLVDTSVRDCRQIDAARIRVSGGAWGDTFQGIFDSAATGLGCRADRLDARLYKLLVYEPGGFFATHRDTEKADGMIATLTISLPVAGGGELVVRHREREAAIDMNAEEPSELAFAAFYADCAHEVRPVRKNHRLSLIFNLRVRAGDEDTPRQAPDFSSHADRIAARLTAWRDRPDASDKLVWLLDHDYSEAGLSFDTLKTRTPRWREPWRRPRRAPTARCTRPSFTRRRAGARRTMASTSMAGETGTAKTRTTWRWKRRTTSACGWTAGPAATAAGRPSRKSRCFAGSCCPRARSTMPSRTISGCTKRRGTRASLWSAPTAAPPS